MDVDAALAAIKADPGLRAVIQTARAWGVSPRRFNGWEPKVTVREYPGRMIHSAEPEWDDESRALAVALTLWEADKCGGCGQPLSETTEVDSDGMYRPTVIRCHACTAAQIATEMFQDAPQSSALMVSTERYAARSSSGDVG